MNAKLLLLPLAFVTLFASTTGLATVVTFDDLSETGSGAFFSYQYQGYQGLTWNNILCRNAVLFTNLPIGYTCVTNGLTGDYYGMVSPSNVAVISSGSEIDSASTNFNFFSTYLTGFYNSNLNIEVQGYRGANLVYDQTVIAGATNSTLFTFNFLDIDRLYFKSSGGEPAFGTDGDPGTFIMDNFDFEFVPEPSSLLLAALGSISLVALLRRKRA
jgi:PEP-CTERM motif-containing protein